MSKKCFSCGQELVDGAKQCDVCGKPQNCQKDGLPDISPDTSDSPESGVLCGISSSVQQQTSAHIEQSSANEEHAVPVVKADIFQKILLPYKAKLEAIPAQLGEADIYHERGTNPLVIEQQYDKILFKAFSTCFDIYNEIVSKIPQTHGDLTVPVKFVEGKYIQFQQQESKNLSSVHSGITTLIFAMEQRTELEESLKNSKETKSINNGVTKAAIEIEKALTGGAISGLLAIAVPGLIRDHSAKKRIKALEEDLQETASVINETYNELRESLQKVSDALEKYEQTMVFEYMPEALANLVNALAYEGSADADVVSDTSRWWEDSRPTIAQKEVAKDAGRGRNRGLALVATLAIAIACIAFWMLKQPTTPKEPSYYSNQSQPAPTKAPAADTKSSSQASPPVIIQSSEPEPGYGSTPPTRNTLPSQKKSSDSTYQSQSPAAETSTTDTDSNSQASAPARIQSDEPEPGYGSTPPTHNNLPSQEDSPDSTYQSQPTTAETSTTDTDSNSQASAPAIIQSDEPYEPKPYHSPAPPVRSSFSPGTIVTFGNYDGSPIEWIVLEQKGEAVFLVSRYGLCERRFDATKNTWGDSEIRSWLNESFPGLAFSSKENDAIRPTRHDDKMDGIFLLSGEEVLKHQSLLPAQPCFTRFGTETRWWLRTSGKPETVFSSDVRLVGASSGYGLVNREHSIRPAMWVNLDACDSIARVGRIEPQPTEDASGPSSEANDKYAVGSIVSIGTYEGIPIDWIVLSRKDDMALLISRRSLCERRFDADGTDWESSELRGWLNGAFFQKAFNASTDKSRILTVSHGLAKDRVFLLSDDELERLAPSYKICLSRSGIPTWWWLRTAGEKDTENAPFVRLVGASSGYGFVNRRHAVRPAIWISLPRRDEPFLYLFSLSSKETLPHVRPYNN